MNEPPAAAAAAARPTPNPQTLPHDEAARLALVHADLLAKKGHEAKAIQQYEAARQHNPNVNVSNKLGVLYDRQDNDAKALAEYQRALKANPRDSNTLNDVGYFYLARERYAEAEPYLRKALEADTKNQKAWGNLALALAYQGRYADAYECWTKVATPAQAHHNIAMVMLQQQRPDLARRSLEKAVQTDPNLKIAQAVLQELDQPRPAAPLRKPQETHLPQPPARPAASAAPSPDQRTRPLAALPAPPAETAWPSQALSPSPPSPLPELPASSPPDQAPAKVKSLRERG